MLTVLCPSRGRPDTAHDAYEAFLATRESDQSEMVFVLDEDDPKGTEYQVPLIRVPRGRPGMTDALNRAVEQVWDAAEVIGFVGDDHRFRTPGWDRVFLDHLRMVDGGLAYGNDRNWPNGEIPTQIFASSEIWKALGWMALPTARHLYLDNAWRVIGDTIERLYYFPDVVIEHMHPAYAKGQWDDQYLSYNNEATFSEDRAAFEEWLASGAERDIDRVRSALGLRSLAH